MKILPAIDLLAGRAVRLLRGDYQQSSDYGEPPEAARRFAKAGAKRLHLVDLDGARDGQPANLPAVRAVASACKKRGVKIQLGGGIRNLPAVRSAIAAGADRVVLGTAAVRDPAFRNAAIAAFPEKIILALDARDGELALQGWRENSGVNIQSFLNELRENPPAAILHTDIARDGAMAGVNIPQTREVCESAPCPVIASGGVSSVDDLRALAQIPNLAAAIVGRAFYNGALNPETVLAEFKNNNGSGDGDARTLNASGIVDTVDNDSGTDSGTDSDSGGGGTRTFNTSGTVDITDNNSGNGFDSGDGFDSGNGRTPNRCAIVDNASPFRHAVAGS